MIDQIVTEIKILKQVSLETTKKEVKDLNLHERLRAANKTAWTQGCGLAAIQIGVPLRFAWLVCDGYEETLLNPVIISRSGQITIDEGCLSLPKVWFTKPRSEHIEYISHGKKKKASGFKARIIQHEIDHMNGVLVNGF